MKNQLARTRKLPSRSIKNSINDLTYQICQLRNIVDDSDETSIKYNRMLIERANLRQKYKEEAQSKSIMSILLKKFSLKKEPKSICDYFESN